MDYPRIDRPVDVKPDHVRRDIVFADQPFLYKIFLKKEDYESIKLNLHDLVQNKGPVSSSTIELS